MEYGKKLTNPVYRLFSSRPMSTRLLSSEIRKLLLRRAAANLDDLMIAWFCLIDDVLPEQASAHVWINATFT